MESLHSIRTTRRFIRFHFSRFYKLPYYFYMMSYSTGTIIIKLNKNKTLKNNNNKSNHFLI